VNAQDYSYKWTYVSADKPTPCDLYTRAACINENGACHAVRVLHAQDFEPVVGEYLRRKMTRALLVEQILWRQGLPRDGPNWNNLPKFSTAWGVRRTFQLTEFAQNELRT
jgi:hypothetical protein